MNIYDKMDFLCNRNKITRKELAESTNIPYATLNSMIARQSTNISLDTIKAIAKYFSVTLDYLIDDGILDPNYGKKADFEPTFEEGEHIKKIRHLDDRGRAVVDSVIEKELEFTQKKQPADSDGLPKGCSEYGEPLTEDFSQEPETHENSATN